MRRLLSVALLAIGIAQAQEHPPGQGVNFYSKDKEIALGQQLALEYRSKTTPLDSPAVSDYVKRVAASLAAQFPGWTYQVEAIREDQGGAAALAPRPELLRAQAPEATHEPAAFPGGPIFVSADLFLEAQNEAEFAGMLAHAMAHVAARHGTRSATKGDLAAMAMQVQAVSMPDRPQVPMGFLAFQRACEAEADYLAVNAMAAAGYDPAGLASYLGRVQPARGKGDGSAVFASLPPRDQRVAAIQAEIRTLPARAYEASDEFARVQAEVKALMPASIKK